MNQYVTDCVRCDATNSTHDILGSACSGVDFGNNNYLLECFVMCRNCQLTHVRRILAKVSSVPSQVVESNALAALDIDLSSRYKFNDKGPIVMGRRNRRKPPEHLPDEIEVLLSEGNTALANNCFNAAGAMYRLVLDQVTKKEIDRLIASKSSKLNTIYARVEWLVDEGHFPNGLKDLATSIRLDGNDAAHDGTLTEIDAEELADFTTELLIRVYTDPKRLELAEQRRKERRAAK